MGSSQTYEERCADRGFMAEDACSAYLDSLSIVHDRVGFNGTKLSTWKLPMIVRKLPEFLCETVGGKQFFVECKGCGHGGLIKVKIEDMEALRFWDRQVPVNFFFYNSEKHEHSIQTLAAVDMIAKTSTIARFHDNRLPYYELSQERFTWKAAVTTAQDTVTK